jgi:hypothetical protein
MFNCLAGLDKVYDDDTRNEDNSRTEDGAGSTTCPSLPYLIEYVSYVKPELSEVDGPEQRRCGLRKTLARYGTYIWLVVGWYLKESRTPMLPLGTERGLTFEMDPLTSPFVFR